MIGLFAAVERGDVSSCIAQLPQDAKKLSKMTDYRRRTAMHLAVECGNEEMVAVLLGHGGIDLLAKDCGGFTALHLAAELGHAKIVVRLLGESSEEVVQAKAQTWLTCLDLAVIRGHIAVVKLLLKMAPVLVTLGDSLRFAVEYGHEEITEMLVESAKSRINRSEHMFNAAIKSGYDKIVNQFLDHQPKLIDARISYGMSPLHLAAMHGRGSIVSEFFAWRQPRLAEVGGSYTGNLLHFAAEYGCETIVAELLTEQPHLIDVPNKYGRNVLELAAGNGHEKIVEQLLAHRPLLIEDRAWCALHSAAAGGHVKVVEQLLGYKPELIDAQDTHGATALTLACRCSQPDVVACLLARGPAVINEKMFWVP